MDEAKAAGVCVAKKSARKDRAVVCNPAVLVLDGVDSTDDITNVN
jgi:hypothetical protein